MKTFFVLLAGAHASGVSAIGLAVDGKGDFREVKRVVLPSLLMVSIGACYLLFAENYCQYMAQRWRLSPQLLPRLFPSGSFAARACLWAARICDSRMVIWVTRGIGLLTMLAGFYVLWMAHGPRW